MFLTIIKSSRIYHWPIIILNACMMEYSLSRTWHTGLVVGIALCFAASYGFIINDIKDVNTDRINGVDRLQNLSQKSLNITGLFATLIAIISIIIASSINLLAIIVTASVLASLFAYSFFVRKTILANILCTLICTSPLWSIYFIKCIEPNLINAGIVLTALLLLFIREIVFDMEDRKGDEIDGRNSLPISLGIKYTKFIISFFLILGLISLLFGIFPLFLMENLFLKFITIILFMGFSMLFIIPYIILFKEESWENYRRFSNYTRLAMIILPLFLFISTL